MKKTCLYLLAIIWLYPIVSEGQTMTDKGMKTYWSSMKKLERKGNLSAQEWQKLWDAPGFNKWMSSERSQNIFKQYFTFTYSPAYKDSLAQKLATVEGFRKVLYEHHLEVKKKRKQLKRFVRKLKSLDLIPKAKDLVRGYLPDGFTVENDPTEIAYMIFQPDGFAYDDTIIIDALFAYNYGENFEKFLAHELHHVYVGNYISKLNKVSSDDPHFQLIQGLRFLRLEGTADLIDKVDLLEKTNKNTYEINYAGHYQKSKTYLQTIDSLLQEIADDPEQLAAGGKKIRKQLPYNGHPTGLYIAHLIEKHHGREGTLSCLENPFTFIKLYNSIAKEYDGVYHVFSEKSMQYLAKLEKQFMLTD